jgi:hypothetical protein
MTEPDLMVANRKAVCQHILRETAPVVHRVIRVRSWTGRCRDAPRGKPRLSDNKVAPGFKAARGPP